MAMFVQDLMAGNGVELTSRAGETGATWERTYGSLGNSQVNGGYFNNGGTQTMFRASGTPAGNNYEVHAFTTYRGSYSGFEMTGPAVEMDGSGSCYAAGWRIDSNGVCLYKYTSGSRTLLTSVARSTPSAGTAVKLTLRRVWTGSTNNLTVYIDDVAVITDYQDASYNGVGRVGLIGREAINSTGVLGAPQAYGFPIDSIEAWDVAGGASITLQQVERGRGVLRGLGRGL